MRERAMVAGRKKAFWFLGIAALLAAAPPVISTYWLSILTLILIFGILAMSLDILMGYTGLPSFGHAAFFGVAAYAVAILSTRYQVTFLLGVNILLLLLGCVLDATTIILVIIPLFLPTCRELGIDLVHFGVVAVVNCMIGLITPPYGILLFVLNAVTGIPLGEIIREIWPFLLALLIALFALVLWPGLVLWLPRQFGYAG